MTEPGDLCVDILKRCDIGVGLTHVRCVVVAERHVVPDALDREADKTETELDDLAIRITRWLLQGAANL